MIERLFAWLDTYFVPDWRKSWKWPEIQLAASLPVILAVVNENWGFILRIVDHLPQNGVLRALVLIVVAIAVIGTPVVARLVDTEKKTDV